jgi:hypothetical protein
MSPDIELLLLKVKCSAAISSLTRKENMAKSFKYFVLLGGATLKFKAPAGIFLSTRISTGASTLQDYILNQQLHSPLTSHTPLPEIDKSEEFNRREEL